MEFMNRSGSARQPQSPQAPIRNEDNNYEPQQNNNKQSQKNPKRDYKTFAGSKVASIILLFTATILAVAAIAAIGFANSKSESDAVDTTKMQAVFLNGGQVYFGRITELNKQFMQLNDIYYLRVNQQIQPDGEAQSNDISLVKLGCELHGPEDQMVINREQIIFWENLKNEGQVAQAVAQYREDFPNGQDCEEQQQQAQPEANNSEETAPLLDENATQTEN